MSRAGRRRGARIAAMTVGLVLAAGAVPALVASAGAHEAARSQRAAQPESVEVDTGDNFFEPKKVKIDVGTTVRWTNTGRNVHNVIGDKKKFGIKSKTLRPDQGFEFTFDKPGKYGYYCSFHGAPGSGQFGTITVRKPPPPPPTAPPTEPAPSGASALGARAAAGDSSPTIRVPDDADTIQAAVDDAEPGTLVLVEPGVYKEAVTVTTPRIVIRGVDRNTTILDGELERENGIMVVDADGVAVENLTARNFQGNGFFWTGVDGYRGSYLTAVRNGDYGIYAFDAVNGQFDHSYASGSPDAGFYIGQCKPCNAVITESEAEWNGLGYSGTNATDLVIASSSWHDNRAGIVPNSGSFEELFPQDGTTIVGNHVYANSNGKTSAIEIAEIATGNGILLAGGNNNVVERNLVEDHDITGISVVPLPEKVLGPDDPEAINFEARNNRVVDNIVRDNTAADLSVVTTLTTDTDTGGNCFAGNEFTTSLPTDVQALLPCDAPASPEFRADIARFAELLGGEKPQSADYRKVKLPKPPKLASMPKAKTARARPATNEPTITIDVDAIELPSGA